MPKVIIDLLVLIYGSHRDLASVWQQHSLDTLTAHCLLCSQSRFASCFGIHNDTKQKCSHMSTFHISNQIHIYSKEVVLAIINKMLQIFQTVSRILSKSTKRKEYECPFKMDVP